MPNPVDRSSLLNLMRGLEAYFHGSEFKCGLSQHRVDSGAGYQVIYLITSRFVKSMAPLSVADATRRRNAHATFRLFRPRGRKRALSFVVLPGHP